MCRSVVMRKNNTAQPVYMSTTLLKYEYVQIKISLSIVFI